MIERLKRLTPRVIGQISVDAGIVWIGDPCYILHKEELPNSLGNDWDDFCELLGDDFEKSFDDGLGVCTSTKYGDGTYDVVGFYDGDSNRPTFVMIDFESGFFED